MQETVHLVGITGQSTVIITLPLRHMYTSIHLHSFQFIYIIGLSYLLYTEYTDSTRTN